MKFKHRKTGKLYEYLGTAIDATNNSLTEGKEMVIYKNKEGQSFIRERGEFLERFEKEPDRCCVCGTTENLHKDEWYGYRCNKSECVPY